MLYEVITLERGGHVYIYVMNVQMPETDDLYGFVKKRHTLLRVLLRDQGLM